MKINQLLIELSEYVFIYPYKSVWELSKSRNSREFKKITSQTDQKRFEFFAKKPVGEAIKTLMISLKNEISPIESLLNAELWYVTCD